MSEEAEAKKPKWRFLGQVLGALGVILSLVFVAWEIRQNTEAVKSATIQAISEQTIDGVSLLLQNEDLRKSYIKVVDGQDLSEDQLFQVEILFEVALRIQMNRLMQIRLGILEIETALFIGGKSPLYQVPYFTEYWIEQRERYPADFVEYMENSVMAGNETLHGQ